MSQVSLRSNKRSWLTSSYSWSLKYFVLFYSVLLLVSAQSPHTLLSAAAVIIPPTLRDIKGKSKLHLSYKISCIRGSTEIPSISLPTLSPGAVRVGQDHQALLLSPVRGAYYPV